MKSHSIFIWDKEHVLCCNQAASNTKHGSVGAVAFLYTLCIGSLLHVLIHSHIENIFRLP